MSKNIKRDYIINIILFILAFVILIHSLINGILTYNIKSLILSISIIIFAIICLYLNQIQYNTRINNTKINDWIKNE